MTPAQQAAAVADLRDELLAACEAGSWVEAEQIRDEITVTSSLARLLHPATPRMLTYAEVRRTVGCP